MEWQIFKLGQAKPGKRPPDIRKLAWDQVAQEPVLTTDTMTLVSINERSSMVPRKNQGRAAHTESFRSIAKGIPVTSREAGLGVKALCRPAQSLWLG